jgi:hypothetical protein
MIRIGLKAEAPCRTDFDKIIQMHLSEDDDKVNRFGITPIFVS